MPSTDTPLICLNGHVINKYSEQCPEYNKKFCESCGEKTINKCQSCNNIISWISENEAITPFIRPSYCGECGTSFPWINTALDSAKRILENQPISIKEKQEIIQSLHEITKNTSKTGLNVLKIKGFASKIGSDAYKVIHSIAIDISTEMAKKLFLG